MMDNIEKLKETFYSEADDILGNLDELLLQLENEPGNRDTLDAIFRNMHTLKGSSGIFEFHPIEKLAHACEDLLDFMRNEGVSPSDSEKMIDTLFSGFDQLKDILSKFQTGTEPSGIPFEETINTIRSLLPEKEHKGESKRTLHDPGVNKGFIRTIGQSHRDIIVENMGNGKRIYQISIVLSKYCFYKGMDPLVLLKNLMSSGDILFVRCSTEHIPPLDNLNPFMLYLDDIWLTYSTVIENESIQDIFEFAISIGDVTLHPLSKDEIIEITPVSNGDDWEMDTSVMESRETATSSTGLKNIFFEFMEESNSYLEDIESLILKLEKERGNLNIVNELFRPFHTIKGNCGYLGLKELGSVCHSIETLLDGVRNQTIPVNQIIIEMLLEAVDVVKKLRASLPWQVKDKFGLVENELNKYPHNDPFDCSLFVKKIESFIKLAPTLQDNKGLPKIGEILIATGDISEEQLSRALRLQERRLGEILVEEGLVPADKVKTALEIQEYQKSSTKTTTGSIKVDTEKIDSLVNLVGELVISETLISQNQSIIQLANQGQSVQKDISHLEKITREIQDHVMSMRMLPIKQTFQKMLRVVRDVAKKAGKNAELIISGEDTELDKTVIEEISDPLVHIVRNSVDHGIEPPDERRLKGKPEKGVINLDAFHRGGSIVIEIRDDGRGLSKDKILRKAIEKGIIEDSDDLTEQQIYCLIFQAGFSTAEAVTDISGRGVGMDVVRRNIEKLRGRVDIQSKEGVGTTISITLPLTLAIIDGMVVQVGPEKYIIPTLSIKESIRPRKEEIIKVQGKGEVCNLRGSLLPLIRLGKLYKIESNYKEPWEALVVIVEDDGMQSCIMVDELIGQQQVVIKTLGDTFKNVKGVSGGAILGNGKVGLILDVRGLIDISLT